MTITNRTNSSFNPSHYISELEKLHSKYLAEQAELFRKSVVLTKNPVHFWMEGKTNHRTFFHATQDSKSHLIGLKIFSAKSEEEAKKLAIFNFEKRHQFFMEIAVDLRKFALNYPCPELTDTLIILSEKLELAAGFQICVDDFRYKTRLWTNPYEEMRLRDLIDRESNLILNLIQKQIDLLPVSGFFVLGASTSVPHHAFLFEISRSDEQHFSFSIFDAANIGPARALVAGQTTENGRRKSLCFKNIKKSDLLDRNLWKMFIQKNCELSDLYQAIRKRFKEEAGAEETLIGSFPTQTWGNCAMACILSWVQTRLAPFEGAFEKLQASMAVDSFEEMSRWQPPQPQIPDGRTRISQDETLNEIQPSDSPRLRFDVLKEKTTEVMKSLPPSLLPPKIPFLQCRPEKVFL